MQDTMSLPLSILDQSPIVAGAAPRDAVLATIALARRADELGYRRYWLAEHHAMPGLADASPEVLLARLTGETSRIRLGTGGIMLPHYSALKVAESFRMLEALAPGRIDLGIGRAPGGTGLVNAALESREVGSFPQQVRDVIDFLDGTTPAASPFAPLSAMPSGRSSPAVWLLGSSDYGALLAAQYGLPYAFAHFIGGDAAEVTHAVPDAFQTVAALRITACHDRGCDDRCGNRRGSGGVDVAARAVASAPVSRPTDAGSLYRRDRTLSVDAARNLRSPTDAPGDRRFARNGAAKTRSAGRRSTARTKR